MADEKIKLFRVPDGASHAEITWDADKKQPKIKWHRKKTESSKPDEPPARSAPSTADNIRSFFTGKGPGVCSDDDDDAEDQPEDDGDDDGTDEE